MREDKAVSGVQSVSNSGPLFDLSSVGQQVKHDTRSLCRLLKPKECFSGDPTVSEGFVPAGAASSLPYDDSKASVS